MALWLRYHRALMVRFYAKTLKSLHVWFLHIWWQRLVSLRAVLAWSAGLWLTVVAVPFAFLYPEEGLDRRICMALALLSPVGVLAAVPSGEATMLLGAALGGLVPILVACPALHGPRTSGPVQGLWLAILLLGLLRAVWNHDSLGQNEADLRRLTRVWQGGKLALADRLVLLLAPVWLALAWRVGEVAADQVESARAARLAGAALCWVAVRLVPMRGALPGLDGSGPLGDRWPLWLGRRLSWLALFGGLWWLWHRPG